jgi:hypothetical protein
VFHRGNDLIGLKHFGLEKRLEQNSTHLAGSENGYSKTRKRLTGRE